MKFFWRVLCCLVVFLAVLMGVSSLSAEWLGWSGPDEHLRDLLALLEAQRREQRLSHEMHAAEGRVSREDQAIDELQAGKITLFEAAASYRSLYENPRFWGDPRCPRPSWDDGERWCRLVIAWAESRIAFEKSPCEGAALRHHLEDVLEEHLRYHRTVELPE